MNFRPTSTLGSIIARVAFEAEKNNISKHLIDRLLLLAVSEPHSHASRLLCALEGEYLVAQICSYIECEMSNAEPIAEGDGAEQRSNFFAKIQDRLASTLVVGEPLNTGHILLLAVADPTTISSEILHRNQLDYERLLDAMGVLEVDEDRHLDLRLR